jgi:hypothetical protein
MKILIWILAIFLTLAVGFYQRIKSPATPLEVTITTGIQKIQFYYLRSYSGKDNCPIIVQIPDIAVSGFLYYRKFNSSEDVTKINLHRAGDKLLGLLPNQPPGGKLEYRIELFKNGELIKIGSGTPVVIQFIGDIPNFIFWVYVLLMLLTLLFSNISGLYALFNIGSAKFMSFLTMFSLILGGLIIGPLVHQFAFNNYWTGMPFNWNLAENTTLLSFAAWMIVLIRIRKVDMKIWVLTASLITLTIVSISVGLI